MDPVELPERIFRTYDIRGIVGEDLTEEIVERIGLGLGQLLSSEGSRSVAVGHDIRDSSAPFAARVRDGLLKAGLDVIEVGEVPTPLLYWAVQHLGADGGVMITGSHNPVEYNGLKITRGVMPIWGDELQTLRNIANAARAVETPGQATSAEVIQPYIANRTERFQFPDGFKVAIDCGNGTAGPVAIPLFEALGIEVDALYPEPDGTFPNHLPDPEVPRYMKNLCDKVAAGDFQCGFGFDGDSDRVGVIDEKGRKRSADHLLVAFARHLLAQVPGGKIIYDVKCSDYLPELIEKAGGVPILSKTGHSIIKEKMKETGAILAGELSGHICVKHGGDGFDDAFFAALLTLEIIASQGGQCSDLFDGIPEMEATPEVKIPVSEAHKFQVIAALVEQFRDDSCGGTLIDLDGVRLSFDDGWMLIRASNTTANLTVRVEGVDNDALQRIGSIVRQALESHPVDLDQLTEALES
ncbi:MAG TPA: phosphomannomutase/phosphoglucomutase [Planctomycetes bacterium]|nr:phosphomannomutase/phosphoglucomutase [Planctomycetota bacterium]HIK81957.1 phosphomannomutase/phosphoglucomutase [Planctomycetota bacterium]